MKHIITPPTTFYIARKENPYMTGKQITNNVFRQYEGLKNAVPAYEYSIQGRNVPDFVFISNAGLSLPRLPKPVFILSTMKYKQRRNELPYIKNLMTQLGHTMIQLDTTFEGQAECAWFHNYTILVLGYGQRTTYASVKRLATLIPIIYNHYNITPPTIRFIQLVNPLFYHLDLALLSLNTSCIIQPDAFRDISSLSFTTIIPFPYKDNFALNSVFRADTLVTHKVSSHIRKWYEKLGFHILEVDMSEYEKSGGSVRCCVLDLFM